MKTRAVLSFLALATAFAVAAHAEDKKDAAPAGDANTTAQLTLQLL